MKRAVWFKLILGLTTNEALEYLNKQGILTGSIRPTVIDGKYLAVTADFDADRLNVEVDGNGVITNVGSWG